MFYACTYLYTFLVRRNSLFCCVPGNNLKQVVFDSIGKEGAEGNKEFFMNMWKKIAMVRWVFRCIMWHLQISNDLFHLTVLLERTTKIAAGQTLCCLQGKGWKIEDILVRKIVDLGPFFQFPHVMRNLMVSRNPSKRGTLPETNSPQLKMDGWNTI